MEDIKRDVLLDPGRLIPFDMLPRLAELTGEIPVLFAASEGIDREGWRDAHVSQPVRPFEWMDQLAEVTRAYEAAHQLVQCQDELLIQTMASFGRF